MSRNFNYGWTIPGIAAVAVLGGLMLRHEASSLVGMTAAGNPEAAPAPAFQLKTSSFPANGDIPPRFTCEDADLSPALLWTNPPSGTQSFVLITEDPDAPGGTFVHWLLYDLPASTTQLPEGVPPGDEAAGGHQGRNGFEKTGYNGPCPPPGRPHRYFFRLYALDARLNLPPGATRREAEKGMRSHILSQAELMGRFRR